MRARRLDALLALGVGMAALVLQGSRFWSHGWVDYGQADWAVHAYRVKFLATHGLASWDPDWDSGLPLFQGYQFLPHAVTAALDAVTRVGIPRAMILWVALLLALHPMVTFVSLRGLGLGRAGALLGAALAIDNAVLASPAGDFAYMFGMAVLPALVWFVLRGLGTRPGWLGALLLGLTPYLHVYAALAAGLVLAGRYLLERRPPLKRELAQLATAAGVMAFFVLPVVFSARPAAPNEGLFSRIPQVILSPAIAAFGYSAGTLAATALAFWLWRRGRLSHPTLLLACAGAAAVITAYAAASRAGLLAPSLTQLQPGRLVPAAGCLLAMAAAPAGDWLAARRPRDGTRLVAALAVLAAVEGTAWFWAFHMPMSDSASHVTALGLLPQSSQPAIAWTDRTDLGYASYQQFGRFHFPGDYVPGAQWTQTAGRLEALMTDPAASGAAGGFPAIERYLRAGGVRYLRLARSNPVSAALVSGDMSGHLRVLRTTPDAWLAEVGWRPVEAFVAPATALRAATLPDLRYLDEPDQALRDRVLDAYDAVLSAADPATVAWASPTRFSVSARGCAGCLVVTPENWDTTWRASVDGRSLPTQRVGPNRLAIDVGDLRGPVRVEVNHERGWPLVAGAVVSLAAAGVAVGMSAREGRS